MDGHRRQSTASSDIEYARSMYDAGNSCGRREAGRYVCCLCGVVWVVKVEGVSPCIGMGIRGIGWNYVGSLSWLQLKTVES